MESTKLMYKQINREYKCARERFNDAETNYNLVELFTGNNSYGLRNENRHAFYAPTNDPWNENYITKKLMEYHCYPPEKITCEDNKNYPVVTTTYVSIVEIDENGDG